jgi:hypothetical protein
MTLAPFSGGGMLDAIPGSISGNLKDSAKRSFRR